MAATSIQRHIVEILRGLYSNALPEVVALSPIHTPVFLTGESLERPGQIVPLVTSSDQEIDSRCMSGSSIATISSSTARNCLGVYTLTMYPSNGGEKKLLVKVVCSLRARYIAVLGCSVTGL